MLIRSNGSCICTEGGGIGIMSLSATKCSDGWEVVSQGFRVVHRRVI